MPNGPKAIVAEDWKVPLVTYYDTQNVSLGAVPDIPKNIRDRGWVRLSDDTPEWWTVRVQKEAASVETAEMRSRGSKPVSDPSAPSPTVIYGYQGLFVDEQDIP